MKIKPAAPALMAGGFRVVASPDVPEGSAILVSGGSAQRIELKGADATDTAQADALVSLRARYGEKAEMKSFTLSDVKALDDDAGTFEGYLSVFDVVDHGNDLVVKGAFAKTLAERAKSGRLFPLLWYHNPTDPLGVFTELVEDAKGLKVKGKLNLDVQAGREKYALLKQGAIDSMSIGYTALKWETVKGVRRILEIKLWEGSLVTFAMNEAALVTSVKAGTPGDAKAADFATTLSLNERRSALCDRRWAIDRALGESMRAVMAAENLDRDGKLAAIDDNLGQYHDALLAWFADWLSLIEDEAAASGEDATETKGLDPFAPEGLDTKAGRKISAATRREIEGAITSLTKLLEDALASVVEATEGEQDGTKDAGDGTAAPAQTQPEGAPVASLVEQMKAGDALARMKAAQ